MTNSIKVKNFEVHNVTIAPAGVAEIKVANYDFTPMTNKGVANRTVHADGFMITAIGNAGTSIGVKIDSADVTDTEFFQVATGSTILMRLPVKYKLNLKNDSESGIDVSIAFIRGRNRL